MNKRTINSDIGSICCIAIIISGCMSTFAQSASMDEVHLSPSLAAKYSQMDQYNMAASAAIDQGNYALAEKDAFQSVSLGTGSGLGEVLLGSAYFYEGKSNEALHIYRQLIEVQHNSAPGCLLPYALLELNQSQWLPAVSAYNEALPQIGDVGLLNGPRILAARNHFSSDNPQPKALEMAIHIALGYIYTQRNVWAIHDPAELALKQYEAAISLEPNSPLANLAYANGLWNVGRKKEAVAAFQHVADTFTGDVKASAEDALTRYRIGANHN